MFDTPPYPSPSKGGNRTERRERAEGTEVAIAQENSRSRVEADFRRLCGAEFLERFTRFEGEVGFEDVGPSGDEI